MGETPPHGSEHRLFGRATGHKLSGRQQALVDTLLPQLSWPDEGPLNPAEMLPGFESRVLEIGFGSAEHLIGQAERHPCKGFLGIEPFLNGVAKALVGIEGKALKNVRVKRGDAREEMERMPDQQFDEVYLLFPDPWPKRKHDKRRFVQPDTARELARMLKPGGRLRIGTDVKVYANWALPILLQVESLSWTGQAANDWREEPDDHITTRYQTKNLGDCLPVFMDFIKS